MKIIETPDDLPPAGSAETGQIEFKAALNLVSGKPDFKELAKDIAAFANAGGGTILVPATENEDGVLAGYRPVDAKASAEICDAYDQAAKGHCCPAVTTTVIRIPFQAAFVVALNVPPSPAHTVGVKVSSSDKGWPAYVFPLRVGRNTTFYDPATLPIREHRQTLLALAEIPVGALVDLLYHNDIGGRVERNTRLVHVDFVAQTILFRAGTWEGRIRVGDVARVDRPPEPQKGAWRLHMKDWVRC